MTPDRRVQVLKMARLRGKKGEGALPQSPEARAAEATYRIEGRERAENHGLVSFIGSPPRAQEPNDQLSICLLFMLPKSPLSCCAAALKCENSPWKTGPRAPNSSGNSGFLVAVKPVARRVDALGKR